MEGKRENCPFDESSLLASFHGSLSSEEAELILTGKPPGTFLFRNSSQGANLFVLSCVRADDQGNEAVLHARFQVSSLSAVEGYFFANYPARVCSTLHELITPCPLYIFPLSCQTKEKEGGIDSAKQVKEHASSQDLVFSPELFISIFFHLDLPSLARVALTCKYFYMLSKDETMWRAKYLDRFGKWVPPIFCEKGEIEWKIKYFFDHTSTSNPTEPFVFGILEKQQFENMKWEWWYLRYSTSVNDALVISWKSDYNSLAFFYSTGILEELGRPIDFPLAPPQGQVCAALVYRVKAPRVGYSFKRRPSGPDEVFPTLLALVKHQADQRFHLEEDSVLFETERHLRRVVLPSFEEDPRLRTLLNLPYGSHADGDLFRAVMTNNQCIEKINVRSEMIPILAAIPSERLYPLLSLVFNSACNSWEKGSPAFLALHSWLTSSSCCIRKVSIRGKKSNDASVDASFIAMLSVFFEVISHSKTITAVKVTRLPLTRPALPELQNLFKQIQNVPRVLAICRCYSITLLDEFKASLQGLSNIIEVREVDEKPAKVPPNSSTNRRRARLKNRQIDINSKILGMWKEREGV